MAGQDKSFNLQKAMSAAQSALRRGDAEAARDQYAAVLQRFPANRRAQDGLIEAAQTIARAARPELTQALVDRAIALHSSGQKAEALAEAHLLATAYPDVPLLQNFLAICAHESGQTGLSLAAARRAVKLKADYPEAHLNLAIALTRAGQHSEAISHCRIALDQRPDYGAAHMQLGLLEEEQGDWRTARTHLERATECAGAGVAAYNNLGTLLNTIGDFPAAEAAWEAGLKLAPGSAEMHANLAELKTFKPGDGQIADMQALLSDGKLPDAEAVKLHFALAKAYDDCGDFDEAFRLFLSGNAIRKSLFPYQPSETDAEFAAIRAAYEQGFPAANLAPDMSGVPQPVFIVGLPRSGTTLVEQILASHSAIAGAGEQGHMNRLFPPLLEAENWQNPDRERLKT
ncbi:MAG: tetratricopeptide repeat protein, partial [Rhodobacteraceae bacterium]|nr:tetratricopeptide repeat protein [Paracoccaceae bacterium]